jgi:hypothetical protein
VPSILFIEDQRFCGEQRWLVVSLFGPAILLKLPDLSSVKIQDSKRRLRKLSTRMLTSTSETISFALLVTRMSLKMVLHT